MFYNYFKTAVRSLTRHRFFSFINIFGLSISMTICMAIIMLIADQMMYDSHNTKRDRIFRISTTPLNSDGIEASSIAYATSPMPLKQELLEKYSGVEKIVRVRRGFGNNWIQFDEDVNIPLGGFFADEEIFEVMEYEMEYGDPGTALREPYSVVLSKQAAKKLFKDDVPIGQTIKVGDLGTYTVTGILKETNNKSHIVFEALASMSTISSLEAEGTFRPMIDNWNSYWNSSTYILLEEGKSDDDILPHFSKIFEEHYAPITNPDIQKITFHLQKLSNITPGPFMNNAIGPFLPWIFVYFFAGLAGLIMITSCFNFTNLSIARSLTRAREIGVRKVIGAARWQIFFQFLSEAIIISLVALAISFIFILALKPVMLQFSIAQMLKWDLELNPYVYLAFVAFAIIVGALAGLFPAVVLSGFQPVTVLKNLNTMRLFSKIGLRKGLLIAQFSLSLVFILTVLVVYNQLNLFLKTDHGFANENRILIRLNNTEPGPLKSELSKQSNVISVSASSHIPAAGTTYGSGFKKSLDDKEWTDLSYFSVDEDYLAHMELKLLAGRFFKPEDGKSNSNFLVINEKAVEAFQYTSIFDALGEEVIFQRDSSRKVIIGVVKDYNHQILIQKLAPMALMFDPERFNLLQVAYHGNYEECSKVIEQAWAVVNPTLKVSYKDFQEEMNLLYDMLFGDLVNILSVIAFLAINNFLHGAIGYGHLHYGNAHQRNFDS
ncbi:MAG: FtsX-like permease family protein [Flammeovirgaceae bacterium]|nr:FtsX-like permease family protein [Flammeovirgaceae bacterium]